MVGLLKRLYAPVLEGTLSHWRPVAAVALVLLALALAALSQTG